MLPLHLLTDRELLRVVIAELEEALQTTARVLRTLAVETVRQAHNEARTLEPFALSGSDELVNDALRVVRKVAELCLPDRECVG